MVDATLWVIVSYEHTKGLKNPNIYFRNHFNANSGSAVFTTINKNLKIILSSACSRFVRFVRVGSECL